MQRVIITISVIFSLTQACQQGLSAVAMSRTLGVSGPRPISQELTDQQKSKILSNFNKNMKIRPFSPQGYLPLVKSFLKDLVVKVGIETNKYDRIRIKRTFKNSFERIFNLVKDNYEKRNNGASDGASDGDKYLSETLEQIRKEFTTLKTNLENLENFNINFNDMNFMNGNGLNLKKFRQEIIRIASFDPKYWIEMRDDVESNESESKFADKTLDESAEDTTVCSN